MPEDHQDFLPPDDVEEVYPGIVPAVNRKIEIFPESVGIFCRKSSSGAVCLSNDGSHHPVLPEVSQHAPQTQQGNLVRLIYLAMSAWYSAGIPWVHQIGDLTP